jgi:raffinose/stachyose/melibiose transport system substrate-binding protein
MIPYAFEEGIDTILTNSPSWWFVYNEGNVDAAKAFLQWCSEDEAQQVFVEECGYVSPFKSCAYVADDPFAQTITDYVAAGKTSSWHWQSAKSDLADNYTGVVFQDYAAGNMDAEAFVKTMEQVTAACYAN